MTYRFGEDKELDQLRTSHNISKVLSNPKMKQYKITKPKTPLVNGKVYKKSKLASCVVREY